MDLNLLRELINDLHAATSQNISEVKVAELKFKEWEKKPNFYNLLQNILSDYNTEVNVRCMATMVMKNGAEKYWRKKGPNNPDNALVISEDDKMFIRHHLIADFNEPINQIAIQKAVLISKIARMDFPEAWPELFPKLIQGIESNETLSQYRAIIILQHVVKALASKRLAHDVKKFQEFTSQIFTFVVTLWNNFTNSFMQGVMGQIGTPDIILLNLEKAIATLKILRKFTDFGFPEPRSNNDYMNFISMIFDKIKDSCLCIKQIKTTAMFPSAEPFEKYTNNLMKVLSSMVCLHTFSYIDLIERSLNLCYYYLFTNEGSEFLYSRFTLLCFNLMKRIILCGEYKPAKVVEMTRNKETLRAYRIKEAFFTNDIICDILRKLVGHYFLLKQEELEVWDSDPELFATEEVGDSSHYSYRPALDKIFLSLFIEYRRIATPVVLEMIASINMRGTPDNMDLTLKRDAIYHAAGLCAFELFDELDFDQWFTNNLLEELSITHSNYRIIRRSVILLVGKWAAVKLSFNLRPILYECIVNLLKPQEDLVVRLTSALVLQFVIDDFDFAAEQFKSYMFAGFNLLFLLLKEVVECETKMRILNVMTHLVERMGSTVTDYTDSLIEYLPHLWDDSENHNMLRCAIVSTLVQIIKSTANIPSELKPFLLPIIRLGTDTNRSDIVYLLEDALDLWTTILEHSSESSSDMVQLLCLNMPPLIRYSTENLQACLHLCTVQFMLAAPLLGSSVIAPVFSALHELLNDLKPEGVIMVTKLLDICLRVGPPLELDMPIVPLLRKIYFRTYVNYDENSQVLSSFISLLSRLLLTSRSVFVTLLMNTAVRYNEHQDRVLYGILDNWLKHMPNVAQFEQRKLLALGLVNFMTTDSPIFRSLFNRVMTNVLECLNDITRTEYDGTMIDSLILQHDNIDNLLNAQEDQDDCLYSTEHNKRDMQIVYSDPIHKVVLKDYLQGQLNDFKSYYGEAMYQELMNTIDPDVASQLKDYVTF